MDAQLKKGALEMCVLFIVKQKPAHGYSVMKTVKEYFPDVYEGTIYTVLRRLANDGMLDSLEDKSAGKPRKNYTINEKGILYLNECISQWNDLIDAVKGVGIE